MTLQDIVLYICGCNGNPLVSRALNHKASYSAHFLTATRILHFLIKSNDLTGYQYFFNCLLFIQIFWYLKIAEKQLHIKHSFNLNKSFADILKGYFIPLKVLESNISM